jgi:hypothetical protein
MEAIPTEMLEQVIGKRERGALMNMKQRLLLLTCASSARRCSASTAKNSAPGQNGRSREPADI